ncbi:hypothetical protein RHMOL_Rhmol05G0196700 [Rhododendron molle]|uniref:Uncharacterized protein n=1 Tax=Rhododendron molle TaxID=49168 RepID=A0ACC0NSZ9_RHOML|nr:hypothetical protein RHMOL_Rhmol05G0196700 [Rhododendron molle]
MGLNFARFRFQVLAKQRVGMALLSLTATASVRLSPFMATLAANVTFVSGLFAWMVAQSVKVLNFFVEKKWDLRIMFASAW